MNLNQVKANIKVFQFSNPGRIGWLTGKVKDGLATLVQVDWEGKKKQWVDVSSLQIKQDEQDICELIEKGLYGTLSDLQKRMTFEKLSGQLTDFFYSMGTSEIDFYAHQFKPVIRFTESATYRLLISDEVGLGKTIEAGLIWREWQAREDARRLLVICPPSLIPKWVRELQEKFQIPARAADANTLYQEAEQYQRSRNKVTFALVTSYNALRPSKAEWKELEDARRNSQSILSKKPKVRLLDFLREESEDGDRFMTKPFLDMVIFDEAHMMRNTQTASARLGSRISDIAGAAVYLSATPVHNKSADLFSILRFVDEDVFTSEDGFHQLCNQNIFLVRLLNLLAEPDFDQEGFQSLVTRIKFQNIFGGSQYAPVIEACEDYQDSHENRIRLRNFLESYNPLNSFINRTRKRDVQDARAIRRPVTVPVTLTEEEKAFHQLIESVVSAKVKDQGKKITAFHLQSPALKLASCLPAVAEQFREGRWGDEDEIEWLLDEVYDDFDFFPEDKKFEALELFQNFKDIDFESGDTKYNALIQTLRLIDREHGLEGVDGETVKIDPSDKIIVFAYFKPTLTYLERRLRQDGYPCICVTGDITDKNERDHIMQRFAQDENRMMLMSEVGAEGLDLQYARVLVNYDLPWNPMRVEQRIGRIDRIGQKAESIAIVNFHVLDTIDGRVFEHLHNKIRIFEDSVGGLEGILGDVQTITQQYFTKDLSKTELETQLQQSALAAIQRANNDRELETQGGALLAFNDLLSERVSESKRLDRYLKPFELNQYVENFLSSTYDRQKRCGYYPDTPDTGCVKIQLSVDAQLDFETFCKQQDLEIPIEFTDPGRPVNITYDPDTHAAMKSRNKNLILVTHIHPLLRWATSTNTFSPEKWHPVSAVRCKSNVVTPGRWFYLVKRHSMSGLVRSDNFYFGLIHTQTCQIIEGSDAEELVANILKTGETNPMHDVPDFSACYIQLEAALSDQIQNSSMQFKDREKQRIRLRSDQQTRHFERKIQQQEQRIQTAKQNCRKPNIIKGFETQLEKLKAALEKELLRLDRILDQLDSQEYDIVAGLVDVAPDEEMSQEASING
jgi:SNF2 family DNA or RNA helicase